MLTYSLYRKAIVSNYTTINNITNSGILFYIVDQRRF